VKGEYFANANFTGAPLLTRNEHAIDFDWNAASPAAGVPATGFSVRWTGTLSAPAPGDYAFSVDIGDCYPYQDRETYALGSGREPDRVFFADPAGFERGRRTGQTGCSTGRVFGDDRRRAAFGRGACDGKFCRDWFRADTGIAASVLSISE
jgi:hypothetical protein